MSHKKFGPDRFSRFDVYWIQTNRQTDKPNLYIDIWCNFVLLVLDLNILFTLRKDNFADLAHFIISFRNGPSVSFGTYISTVLVVGREEGRKEKLPKYM